MPLYSIETHGQLQPHLGQEWLLSNGMGAFASSTVVGCNTRRYHGVLIGATLPPLGRIMALNRMGEIITRADRPDYVMELGVNQFGQDFHPRGEQYLRRFELNGTATWHYDVEGISIVKEVQVLWGQNVAGVRYTIDPGAAGKIQFALQPFVSLRDFHSQRHAEGSRFETHSTGEEVVVSQGNLKVHLRAAPAGFQLDEQWWYGHSYAIEIERGFNDKEDLFSPGRFVIDIEKPTTFTVWVSLETVAGFDWDEQLALRPDPCEPARARTDCKSPTPAIRKLMHAAMDFIVARKAPDGSAGTTILAGYPWFSDWGRDTMIALPGLLLTTGRFDEAGKVLSVFANYVSEGMIPNRFDDYTNEPSYNTVDASLWFIHSVYTYLRASKDTNTFETTLLPACRAIVDGYRAGTRFHIKMDEADGLITQGDATTQLTWMDAKHEGRAFTPRQGKAVEINALWYNALVCMGESALAAKVKENFAKTFWISPFRGLADVITDGRRDALLRPNQIYAVSLPHSPLSAEQQAAVVEVVRRELLTPMGLRSLARSDANYHGTYFGPPAQRDEAYHNGMVWAWLIGGFLDAYLRVNNRSTASIAQARQWLQPLITQMESAYCIGQIAEIFEADEPYRPVGAMAQAWSVAEVLRLAVDLGM